MRKSFFVNISIIFMILVAAKSFGASTESENSQANRDERHISTQYFDITIPEGWSLLSPLKTVSTGLIAFFGNKVENLAVSIGVRKNNADLNKIARQTIMSLKKDGMDCGDLIEQGGLYRLNVSGKVNGVMFFGSKDGITSITSIMGTNINLANMLLASIKTNYPGLFPTKID